MLELGDLVRRVGEEFGLSEDVLDDLQEDVGRVTVESAVADTADVQAAVGAATAIGTRLLRDMAIAELLYGLVIAGFAALVGSSRFAGWLRELLAPMLVAKPVGSWLSAIGVLLLLLYVLPGEQLAPWQRGVIFVVFFAVALGSLRRQLAKEFPAASLTDSWDVFRSGIEGLRAPSRS